MGHLEQNRCSDCDTCTGVPDLQHLQPVRGCPLRSAGSKPAAAAAACNAMETQEYGDQFTFTEIEASPAVKPQVAIQSAHSLYICGELTQSAMC